MGGNEKPLIHIELHEKKKKKQKQMKAIQSNPH